MDKGENLGALIRSEEGLLALLRQPRIGQRSALFAALAGTPPSKVPPDALWSAVRGAAEEIAGWRATGVETISFFDERYPPLFRELADPPPLIWVRGNVEALHARAVAVVGTREPTKVGVNTARAVAREAVSQGWCVVSGLARGIDAQAHWGALEGNGQTVAVMAGGLDRIYPAENKGLAQEILGSDGALIAEGPPGSRPPGGAFVRRDRLQSALSTAVFICQTGITGGSLHTARFAIRQGRLLFAADATEPRSEKSEGLALLATVPGRDLLSLFREWQGDGALEKCLTERPVARPFKTVDLPGLFAWLDVMEKAVDADVLSPEHAAAARDSAAERDSGALQLTL